MRWLDCDFRPSELVWPFTQHIERQSGKGSAKYCKCFASWILPQKMLKKRWTGQVAQSPGFSSTIAITSASSIQRCTLEASMKFALIATEVSKLSTWWGHPAGTKIKSSASNLISWMVSCLSFPVWPSWIQVTQVPRMQQRQIISAYQTPSLATKTHEHPKVGLQGVLGDIKFQS